MEWYLVLAMKNKGKTQAGKHPKRLDLVLILVSPVIASSLSIILQVNLLFSILLFLILPSIYLSFKNPGAIKRSIVFSLIFGVIAGTLVDFLASYGGDWYVPTIFSHRVFGYVAFEDVVWGFFLVYLITMFYEYFFDAKGKNINNHYLKYFLVFLAVTYMFFFPLFVFQRELLNIPYFYLVGGVTILLIPLMIFLSMFPKFMNKFVITGLFFFLQALIYEVTALTLGHWTFEGTEYIGWVEILGKGFPLEEFVFWFLMFSTAILSYYEFFYDDRK